MSVQVEPVSEGEKAVPLRALGRDLLSLAWPQCVVVCCRNAISLTDVGVVGWLGVEELAAVAYAQIVLNLSAVVLFGGFGDALLTLASQCVGAGNPKLAGVWLQSSFLFMVLGCLPIGVVWFNAGRLLAVVPHGPDAKVCALAATFARWSLVWLLPDACFSAFSQWLMGLQLVRPTIPIHAAFVVFNVAANVALVRGAGPFEGLGFVGSPVATACTKLLRGVVLVVFTCHSKKLHEPYWGGWAPRDALDASRLRRLAAQALPAGLVGVVEQFQFVLITIMVGTLSTTKLAAHSGLLNVFAFVTAGLYGLTDAAAATIGRWLGENRPKTAKRTATAAFGLMGAMGVCVGAVFVAAKSVVGKIFSRDPEVWFYTSNLCLIVGAAYAMLSVTFACFATLQGQARPHVAAISMFAGLWLVSVPCSYVFAFELHLGLNGIWFGLAGGYLLVSIVMAAFVLTSDWAKFAEAARLRSEASPRLGRARARDALDAPLLDGAEPEAAIPRRA